jgi:hypothetical protein
VRQLESDQVIRRDGNARYDLNACRLAVLKHLRSLASGHGGRAEEGLAEQRARLAAAQRSRIELQTKIMRHEYVRVDEAVRQVDQLGQVLLEHFRTVAVRCAPDLACLVDLPAGREGPITDAMRAVVDQHVTDAMAAFQDMNESGRLAKLLAPTEDDQK